MATTVAHAKEYVLPYKKENRWVATEDATDLRNLLSEAREKKLGHYYVQLPAEKRDISIERLMVLRDILEKQVKTGIIIEEVTEGTTPNQIVVHTTKP